MFLPPRDIHTRSDSDCASWTVAAFVIAFVLLFAAPMSNTAQAQSSSANVAAVDSPPLSKFIGVWSDGDGNHEPAIAHNPNHNEYLVVWWNDRGVTRDIYARRVAADGTVLSWFSVISTPNQWNWLPDVAYSPQQDEYLIVFTRKESTTDYNIYARRVAWNGSWISADIPIRTVAGMQWYPAVAYNIVDNEFLVVYENDWSNTLRDIDAQRVRGQDGALKSWRNIATAPGAIRRLPAVAYNEGRNEYLIAYTYGASSAANGEIYGKISSASMGSLSAELKLVENVFHQDNVALAAGADEYLAVWEDGPGAGHQTLYGRRIAGDGTLSPYIKVRDEVNQIFVEPAVSFSPIFGYVTAWRHASSSSTGDDVYARIVVPHTNDTGAVFALDRSGQSQRAPALMCAESGECLFAEEDNGGGNFDIWARRILVERLFVPCVMK